MLGLMAYVLKFETENDKQPRDKICASEKNHSNKNFIFFTINILQIPFYNS
jgi:hypothetical protein